MVPGQQPKACSKVKAVFSVLCLNMQILRISIFFLVNSIVRLDVEDKRNFKLVYGKFSVWMNSTRFIFLVGQWL